jgi:UDP-N-acetylmuramoylalanine--D-glutamate ligase
MKRAMMLGSEARSGFAATALLERRGVEVVKADRRLDNDHDVTRLAGVDVLVKSPGVPGENPIVVEARARGIPVWAEVELAYRLLDVRLVGVTGTNGKTTTSELLGVILDAPVAGNVGRPLSGLDGVEAGTLVVCELSSFQLEDVHELACEVAVLVNLEPDHLDRHHTFEAYRAAKLRIFERARYAVVPRGSGLVGIEFDLDDPLPAEPILPGRHNRENAAAATAAARALGVADARIADALRSFRGVRHRLEAVGEVGGVRYVNDSKATNVAAARRALAAIDTPLHVVLGGSRKGESFETLADDLRGRPATAYLIGETAGDLAAALGEADVRCVHCGSLADAVDAAAAAAKPGDTVLLSPACASFDQFRDFEHRGEEFRRLVQNLQA